MFYGAASIEIVNLLTVDEVESIPFNLFTISFTLNFSLSEFNSFISLRSLIGGQIDVKCKSRKSQPLWIKWAAMIQCFIIIALSIAVFQYRSDLSKSSEATQGILTKYSERLTLIQQQQTEIDQLKSALDAAAKSSVDKIAKDRPASPPHNKDKDEWNENDLKWIKDVQDNDYRMIVCC